MRIPTVLLMVLFAAAACQSCFGGSIFDEAASLDKDKYVHFSAGVIASHASYPLFKRWTRNNNKAMWYSIAFAAALSAGKEWYDRDTTGFNGGDLAAGILGAATILVVEF